MRTKQNMTHFFHYFTLKRIESIFGITKAERDFLLFKYENNLNLSRQNGNENKDDDKQKEEEINNPEEENNMDKIINDDIFQDHYNEPQKEKKKDKAQNNENISKSTAFNVNNNQSDQIDFYGKFLDKRRKTEYYQMYQITYNTFIFNVYDQISFNSFELMYSLCCRCCGSKHKTKIIKDKSEKIKSQISDLEQKCQLFDAAKQKLGLDFDIVSMLKIVDDFDKFKKVYFDECQKGIFESVCKSTIKVTDEEMLHSLECPKPQKKIEESIREFKDILNNMITKGKEVTITEKKLLRIIGIDFDEICTFAKNINKRNESIETNRINKKRKDKEDKEAEETKKKKNDKDFSEDLYLAEILLQNDKDTPKDTPDGDSETNKKLIPSQKDAIDEINKKFGFK